MSKWIMFLLALPLLFISTTAFGKEVIEFKEMNYGDYDDVLEMAVSKELLRIAKPVNTKVTRKRHKRIQQAQKNRRKYGPQKSKKQEKPWKSGEDAFEEANAGISNLMMNYSFLLLLLILAVSATTAGYQFYKKRSKIE